MGFCVCEGVAVAVGCRVAVGKVWAKEHDKIGNVKTIVNRNALVSIFKETPISRLLTPCGLGFSKLLILRSQPQLHLRSLVRRRPLEYP